MDTTCTICHQHAPADCYLCDACTYRMHTWLGGIPRTLPLLRAALAPAAGPAQRGGTGRAHAPLPVDVRALDLLGPGRPVPVVDPHGDQTGGIPVGALLAGWARYLATEVPAVWTDAHGTMRIDRCTDARPRSGTGVSAWSTWLQRYLPYAATRPWAGEMYHQVEDLVARIQRITDTRPRRTPMDAPCPACSAFGLVRREGEQHIGCEACGHRLLPAAYNAHRDQIMHLAVLMAAARETGRRQASSAA